MGGFIRADEGVGENKEFTVATVGVITINLSNIDDKTSANDDPSAGEYYLNNQITARKYVLRFNQSIEITQINNRVFADPTSLVIGDGSVVPAAGIHREEYDQPTVQTIKINILTANTNIKLRVI